MFLQMRKRNVCFKNQNKKKVQIYSKTLYCYKQKHLKLYNCGQPTIKTSEDRCDINTKTTFFNHVQQSRTFQKAYYFVYNIATHLSTMSMHLYIERLVISKPRAKHLLKWVKTLLQQCNDMWRLKYDVQINVQHFNEF